jgi:hypothetical protein
VKEMPRNHWFRIAAGTDANNTLSKKLVFNHIDPYLSNHFTPERDRPGYSSGWPRALAKVVSMVDPIGESGYF